MAWTHFLLGYFCVRKSIKSSKKGANPDSKVHGANMGPIWGWQDPGWPHVGHMNFVIWEGFMFIFVSLSKLLNKQDSGWNDLTYCSYLVTLMDLVLLRMELHNVWNMCDIGHYFDTINKVWCIHPCHSVMQCHNPSLCISLLKSVPKCPCYMISQHCIHPEGLKVDYNARNIPQQIFLCIDISNNLVYIQSQTNRSFLFSDMYRQ